MEIKNIIGIIMVSIFAIIILGITFSSVGFLKGLFALAFSIGMSALVIVGISLIQS